MDVTLTDEQRALVATARALADRHATTSVPPPGEADERYDAAAWRALVATGLPALCVPVEQGGGGAGAVEAVLAVEELARRLVRAPLAGTVLAADLLGAAGAAGPLADLVGGRAGAVVVGDDLLGVAGEGVAWDCAPDALAVGVGGDRVTTGPAGPALDPVDRTRGVRRVTGTAAVGRIDGGRLRRWHALALALVCADLVGTAAGALDAAVGHVRVRTQFGRPVGAFQGVAHPLAEAHVLVEAARSATWHAGWAVDALDAQDARDAAATAKAFCAEVAVEVAETALQAWGGLGMTWEGIAHLYLRRALLGARLFGGTEHHLAAIATRRLGPAQVR